MAHRVTVIPFKVPLDIMRYIQVIERKISAFLTQELRRFLVMQPR